MRKSLVHGAVNHHILVVGDAVSVLHIGRVPVSEFCIAAPRGAKVKKAN